MSCLMDGTFPATLNHLQTAGVNSKIVIWSEADLKGSYITNETEFLKNAFQIAENYGVYLGVSYILQNQQGLTKTSQFSLIVPPNR